MMDKLIKSDNLRPVTVEAAEDAIRTVEAAGKYAKAALMKKRLLDWMKDENVF